MQCHACALALALALAFATTRTMKLANVRLAASPKQVSRYMYASMLRTSSFPHLRSLMDDNDYTTTAGIHGLFKHADMAVSFTGQLAVTFSR